MVSLLKYTMLLLFAWAYTSIAIPAKYVIKGNEDQEKDIAAILSSNNYITREYHINKVISQVSDDKSTTLLSKLSDQELISLLQKQPQLDNFDVLDIEQVEKSLKDKPSVKEKKDSALRVENPVSDQGTAFFRIDNREVEPLNLNFGADPSYLAHQRIQNLLYSRPTQNLGYLDSDELDNKKELLFDILTAQLKKLCCKSSKLKNKNVKVASYEPLLSNIFPNSRVPKQSKDLFQYEQMFLIINDEIKSDQYTDIIFVDPDSLNKNSSVLLLGPITTPLSDPQLKIVMNRITKELSTPEYSQLLQELSEGKVNKANTRLIKSLVTGSNTRRFIKPHRCRYRYPQAQGPKWLICTGYLNINTPSLYD